MRIDCQPGESAVCVHKQHIHVHVCTVVNPYLCVHKHVWVRVTVCVSSSEGGLPSGCCSRARSLTQHWQTMSPHTTPSLLSSQHLLNTHFNKPLAPQCILTSGSKRITMHNTLHKLYRSVLNLPCMCCLWSRDSVQKFDGLEDFFFFLKEVS